MLVLELARFTKSWLPGRRRCLFLLTHEAVAGGRVVCEAKVIWSHYVLLDGKGASRALYVAPLQGRASPYTINAATMRLCRPDHPAPHDHSIAVGLSRNPRGWKPLPHPAPTQNRPAPQAGPSATRSASGASTFLRRQEGPPCFPPQPRRRARPPLTLSIPRLCRFAEQTSLPSTPRPPQQRVSWEENVPA